MTLQVTQIYVPAWRLMLLRRRPRWFWIGVGFGLGAFLGRFLV